MLAEYVLLHGAVQLSAQEVNALSSPRPVGNTSVLCRVHTVLPAPLPRTRHMHAAWLLVTLVITSTHIYTYLHISTLHTEYTDPDPDNPSSARPSGYIQQLLLCYRRDNRTISCSLQHAPLLLYTVYWTPAQTTLYLCPNTLMSPHLHLMGLTTHNTTWKL